MFLPANCCQVADPNNPSKKAQKEEVLTFNGPMDSVYLEAPDNVELDVGTGQCIMQRASSIASAFSQRVECLQARQSQSHRRDGRMWSSGAHGLPCQTATRASAAWRMPSLALPPRLLPEGLGQVRHTLRLLTCRGYAYDFRFCMSASTVNLYVRSFNEG